MTDCSSTIYPKARKKHRCIYCYADIAVGEQYVSESGFYEGHAFRNKFHKECYETLHYLALEWGDEEFIPGEGEPPERLKCLMQTASSSSALTTAVTPSSKG